MTATTLCFCDLPDRIRLAARDAIDAADGYVAGYCGPSVQVAIPCPAGPFFLAMDEAGLALDEHSLHFFPLGTNQPEARLRHPGGYWLFGTFTPRS